MAICAIENNKTRKEDRKQGMGTHYFMICKGLTKKVTFEKTPKESEAVRHVVIWGESM